MLERLRTILAGQEEKTDTLLVVGPFRGITGHDHHVREFVRQLHRHGASVALRDLPEWSPARLPADKADPWFDSLEQLCRPAAVLHFCMAYQAQLHAGVPNVLYTMFEATRIPKSWVKPSCRQRLVLVPTRSSQEAWQAGGVPASRLRICPLGVDSERFRPGVEPLDLKDQRGRSVLKYGTRILNVSELSPRKNLLGLLRVWISATKPADDAILILKLGCYVPGWLVRFNSELGALEKQIGKSRRDCAPILMLQSVLSDDDMPRLFACATHYWSMSHGEGWDQPMAEAGASGLCLIAPSHSAYLSYLDESVARMIPSKQIPAVFAGGGAVARLFQGAEWWEPDAEAAAVHVRQAIEAGCEDGPKARTRMLDFTWENAGRRLVSVLDEAGYRVDDGQV